MTYPALSVADHASLKPCPFCGPDASATPYRAHVAGSVERVRLADS